MHEHDWSSGGSGSWRKSGSSDVYQQTGICQPNNLLQAAPDGQTGVVLILVNQGKIFFFFLF